MNKTLLRIGTLTTLALLSTYGAAHALGLDTGGTNKRGEVKKVAPAANCMLGAYAAFANKADDAADTYAFSGTCDVDLAPEGEPAMVQTVKVQIMGEWSPKMKRASEVVKIIHPDRQIEFVTWSTCDLDPFAYVNDAKCTNQGYGSNDFAPFLRKEDVPFARKRYSPYEATKMAERVTQRSQLYTVGNITSLQVAYTAPVGKSTPVFTNFAGGPGACPMELDYGDGSKKTNSFFSTQPTNNGIFHTWQKPGKYRVRAKALPGCAGEASAWITVTAQ